MLQCFLCKKKYDDDEDSSELDETIKMSCGHITCNSCLGRLLILNEFEGLKNEMKIVFKCSCNNGNTEMSTADYISILNSLLTQNQKKPPFTTELNLTDELTSKLVSSVKKKKRNLKFKTFEEFSKFLNEVESNHMNLFQSQLQNTLTTFDEIISQATKAKEDFISKMDLKMTKLNSIFVILKMVFFGLYKDYESLGNDLKTVSYLSKVHTEFDKVKFISKVEDLHVINEKLKKFSATEHFICKFVFSSSNKDCIDWRCKTKISTKGKMAYCIVQLGNGNFAVGGDGVVHIYEPKGKFLFNLTSLISENCNPIRKIIPIYNSSSNNNICGACQNEVIFWNVKKKENYFTINETKGSLVLNVKEYSPGSILLVILNDCLVKVYNLNNFLCIFSFTTPFPSYSLVQLRNSNLAFGLSNGDVEIYDLNCTTKEIKRHYQEHLGKLTINAMVEVKTKIYIAGDAPEIRVLSSADFSVSELKGHSKSVMCLNSYDHKTLISGAIDGEVRVWDVNRRKCLFAIPDKQSFNSPTFGFPPWITFVIKCQNGTIAAANSEGEIKIYNYE